MTARFSMMTPRHVKVIESPRNPVIQEFQDCFSRGISRRSRLFAVEGPQLVAEAFEAGLCPEAVLVNQDFPKSKDDEALLERAGTSTARLYQTSNRLMSKVAGTENPQGILALFHKPVEGDLAELAHAPFPVLTLVDVQDPGNCGALVRTYAAFGGAFVLTVRGTADLYGSKAVRASAGAIFRTKTRHFAVLEDFTRSGVIVDLPWIGTDPSAGMRPERCMLRPPFLLLIGNEGSGLPASLLALCRQRLCLPMSCATQSLNAAIAGSLMIYELSRNLCIGPFASEDPLFDGVRDLPHRRPSESGDDCT